MTKYTKLWMDREMDKKRAKQDNQEEGIEQFQQKQSPKKQTDKQKRFKHGGRVRDMFKEQYD